MEFSCIENENDNYFSLNDTGNINTHDNSYNLSFIHSADELNDEPNDNMSKNLNSTLAVKGTETSMWYDNWDDNISALDNAFCKSKESQNVYSPQRKLTFDLSDDEE